ncbi:glycosyltransferase family protein [Chachezhania sediminis]|uniref:hypothetical protein n=1 Tax=Chachezhania sediminis TaxID=2599291 RepID=UPI00131B41C2|nr:hypothetical protein [Chachezhania sediminis]
MGQDGVIFVAVGNGYRDLACQAAASLAMSNPGLPVDIFTDGPLPPHHVFDQVHPIPAPHPRAKLDCFARSRFDRTLYLDADVLVLGPLGDLFSVADRFPLAMAHDVRRRSPLVRQGHAAETPYAFPQLNSGVLLYRRGEETAAFFAEWKRRYDAAGHLRDQITLKDLLWDSDIRFYVLPPEFNLRRTPMLDAWEPLDARPTILHSHRLLQHLRGRGQRVTTVEEIAALEREALGREWQAHVGHPGPVPAGIDPAARFGDVDESFDSGL